MKNRVHRPGKTKTLREICEEGGIFFPIDEAYPILVEIGIQDLPEPIMRNFPGRTYSTRSDDPKEIVELLAYEAHEWQALEIQRQMKKENRLILR